MKLKLLVISILVILGLVAYKQYQDFSFIKSTSSTVFTFSNSSNPKMVTLYQDPKIISQDNFLLLPVKGFDSRTKSLEEVYMSDPNWGNYKYFDSHLDKYYILQPGGRIEIGLISTSDLNALEKTNSTMDSTGSGSQEIKDCKRQNTLVGSTMSVAISCHSSWYLVPDNNRLVDESITINCYLPVDTQNYLSISQTHKPVSTNVDLCQTLNSLGYQNLTSNN